MNLKVVHLRGKFTRKLCFKIYGLISLQHEMSDRLPASVRQIAVNSRSLQLTDHFKVTSLVICFLEIQNRPRKNNTRRSAKIFKGRSHDKTW